MPYAAAGHTHRPADYDTLTTEEQAAARAVGAEVIEARPAGLDL